MLRLLWYFNSVLLQSKRICRVVVRVRHTGSAAATVVGSNLGSVTYQLWPWGDTNLWASVSSSVTWRYWYHLLPYNGCCEDQMLTYGKILKQYLIHKNAMLSLSQFSQHLTKLTYFKRKRRQWEHRNSDMKKYSQFIGIMSFLPKV